MKVYELIAILETMPKNGDIILGIAKIGKRATFEHDTIEVEAEEYRGGAEVYIVAREEE